MRGHAALLGRAALALALASVPDVADAHSGGVSFNGCAGCHGVGTQSVSLSSSPSAFAPGVETTVTIEVVSPGGVAAGVYISPTVGNVDTIAGEGLAQVGGGLSHTTPKPMSGGVTRFRFTFTPPSEPGAVRFLVSSLVANGDGAASGDGGDDEAFDRVFGCEPQEFFRDFDGDGHGRANEPLVHCAGTPPEGYSASGDDCDDNREAVHPGAEELCNGRDDDCDAEVDEDATPIELYPDADGDGYYGRDERDSGEVVVGCLPMDGWAAEPGDCQPDDPNVHPGAEEVCNGRDDDCDGRADEGVRPTCGEGWCRREALTCDGAQCHPGEPMQESCNALDDDCDGVVDEGEELCALGEACVAGACRPSDEVPQDGGGTTGGEDPGGAGAASGSDGCDCRTTRNSAPGWLFVLLLGGGLRARRRALRHRSRRSSLRS